MDAHLELRAPARFRRLAQALCFQRNHSRQKKQATGDAKTASSLYWSRDPVAQLHADPFGQSATSDDRREAIGVCLRAAQLGQLYAARFPQQWANSGADTDIGDIERLSKREMEFMVLLADKLPIDTDVLEEYAETGFFADRRRLPFEQCPHWALDSWEPEDLEHATTADLVLVWLGQTYYAEGVDEALRDKGLCDALPEAPTDAGFDDARFMALCEARALREASNVVHTGRAWAQLPAALAMVTASTGSLFLDMPRDDNGGFHDYTREDAWTTMTLDWYEQQWARAEVCRSAWQACVEWLDAKPVCWPDVFALWREAFVAGVKEEQE